MFKCQPFRIFRRKKSLLLDPDPFFPNCSDPDPQLTIHQSSTGSPALSSSCSETVTNVAGNFGFTYVRPKIVCLEKPQNKSSSTSGPTT